MDDGEKYGKEVVEVLAKVMGGWVV